MPGTTKGEPREVYTQKAKQIRKLLKYNNVFLCRLFQKRLQIEKIHSKTHIIHWTEHTQNDTITARNDHFFYIFMTTICTF